MKKAHKTAGNALLTIRTSCGLTSRDVEDTSKKIAAKNYNPDYVVPISKLCNIEAKGRIPSIFCLYSLSRIYKTPIKRLLAFYGVK